MNEKQKEAAREKAVRQYYEEPASIAGDKYPFCVGFDAGYDAGLAAATQWKVIETDGLPEKDGWYLVTASNGERFVGTAEFAGGEFYFGDVIAWAELPAPFTKGETEE